MAMEDEANIRAGLWELWDDPAAPGTGTPLHSATLLTTEVNVLVAPIHDRMPVILSPFPGESMRKESVGTGVNKAGNEAF
ncbi:SOS response-associated peptidase family protein [Megalodesulfovibrio gigas]|uniref:Uncharacterized protein n=1 Tax=Megalodesulfovibrio gigas (strain ATCC 19364 / DSM 1382 / NCIMB 9332 / VKM B-1759) TaxID=1121448 RepID=T2GG89_MEGG1|nr:SOS response-associated peptidase family protein [Megalodesulfovibrio gigas]AGW15007.1 hypothetical protein DGI_3311 [Megalodesulfovibrio gigas DSM 1382 = ATCC 19364]